MPGVSLLTCLHSLLLCCDIILLLCCYYIMYISARLVSISIISLHLLNIICTDIIFIL